MPVDRRAFLIRGGTALAGGAALAALPSVAPRLRTATGVDWAAFRSLFDLRRDRVHLATFFLVSHPRPVRDAIEKHARALDADPFEAIEHGHFQDGPGNLTARSVAAAAAYMEAAPEEIAITGSTTMGLAIVYHGLPLRAGQEIVTTAHDHYAHHEAVRLAAARAGATWRKIALYDRAAEATEEGIVERVRSAIGPSTRAVGVTWVHSSTGVKLPLRGIAEVVRAANAGRSEADRIWLVVDGVHGFGVEDEAIPRTGVDVFVAGTHKWIFGPRGTGILWAPAARWAEMRQAIPSFSSSELFDAWAEEREPRAPARAAWFEYGGFRAFEHVWALEASFGLHRELGRGAVAERIHALNGAFREGLAAMPGIRLHTPRDGRLAAGIVCFEVDGMAPGQVVERLHERGIIATTSPYRVSYARVAGSLVNTPDEVERTLREIRALKPALA